MASYLDYEGIKKFYNDIISTSIINNPDYILGVNGNKMVRITASYQTKEDAQDEHEVLQNAISDEASARARDVAAIEEKVNSKQDELKYYTEKTPPIGDGEYNAEINAHNVGIIGNESVDIQAGTEMRFSGGGQAVFDGNALFEDEVRFETKPIVGSATENEPVAVMSDLESKQDTLNYYNEDVDGKVVNVGTTGHLPTDIVLESEGDVHINGFDSINLSTTGQAKCNGYDILTTQNIQLVDELPSNPSSNVLYLIPEED